MIRLVLILLGLPAAGCLAVAFGIVIGSISEPWLQRSLLTMVPLAVAGMYCLSLEAPKDREKRGPGGQEGWRRYQRAGNRRRAS